MDDLHGVKNALVSLAIERSLFEISEAVCENIGNKLFKKYKCYFHDCLEHPDYLVDVLKQVFGDGYLSIVNSINNKLEEFSYQDQIKEFLLEINK